MEVLFVRLDDQGHALCFQDPDRAPRRDPAVVCLYLCAPKLAAHSDVAARGQLFLGDAAGSDELFNTRLDPRLVRGAEQRIHGEVFYHPEEEKSQDYPEGKSKPVPKAGQNDYSENPSGQLYEPIFRPSGHIDDNRALLKDPACRNLLNPIG